MPGCLHHAPLSITLVMRHARAPDCTPICVAIGREGPDRGVFANWVEGRLECVRARPGGVC